MSKIRVLMVAGTMHLGGQENQLMHLIRHADKDKFQIDFTSTMPDAYYREEIESLGGRFILIPEMDWKKPWEYVRALYKVMREGRYHVVHSHELFHTGITLWVAKLAGVPCRIAHSHSGSDGADLFGARRSLLRTAYNAFMRRLILQYSTMQLACSTTAGRFLYGEKNLQRDTYHLVVNSVDTTRFLDQYDQKQWSDYCGYSGAKNILHVGHVIPLKNQTFLVDIADEFRRRGDNFRIFCAGHGNDDYIDTVKNKIRELHLEDRIILLGIRNDVDALMREADAFVLPSLYEGMPLVMIEAQASGLPCVAADTFSREVDFDINYVTWLRPEDGAKIWADALEDAVNRPKAEKAKTEEAIREHRFDSSMFAVSLCKLYIADCRKQISGRKKHK